MEKKKMKSYATTSSCNGCVFRKDYSYYTNGKCLECSFCYRLTSPEPKVKHRSAGLLDIELSYNDSVLKVPVTVSRYCDPLCNETATTNSIKFMTNVLGRGGQVIFRTAVDDIPGEIHDLAREYKGNFMMQARVFTARGCVNDLMQDTYAPNFSRSNELIGTASIFKDYGCEVSVFMDPYIMGVNSGAVYDILEEVERRKIGKLTIKQLFATEKFKEELSSFTPLYGMMLSKKIGNFWTYENVHLMYEGLLPILDYIKKNNYNTKVAFCSNTNLRIKSNCCLYDNAKAVYEISDINPRHANIRENK